MKKTKPFFAKFLEGQLTDEKKNQVKGGDPIITMTRKAPSDQEEGGIFTTLHDLSDLVDPPVTTQKYPSDQEDQ